MIGHLCRVRALIALLSALSAPVGASAQLTLSDFVVPDGEVLVMGFVGIAGGPVAGGGPWDRKPWDPTGIVGGGAVGSIAEGSNALAPDLNVAGIRCDNANRCQLRAMGDSGFAVYFEPDTLGTYDDGTWHWQDDTEVITAPGRAVPDNRVGSGFYEFRAAPDGSAATVAFANKMWALTDGDRFIFAYTRPGVADNCNINLGTINLSSPADLRVGDATPLRVYLGSVLVCGATP